MCHFKHEWAVSRQAADEDKVLAVPKNTPKGNVPKKLLESQNQPLARGPVGVMEVVLVAAKDWPQSSISCRDLHVDSAPRGRACSLRACTGERVKHLTGFTPHKGPVGALP